MNKEELINHTETKDGFPTYRMWKLDYIMGMDYSYSYRKYKWWLFKQRIKKFLGLKYDA